LTRYGLSADGDAEADAGRRAGLPATWLNDLRASVQLPHAPMI
jgi:hypothetical protein